jgi:hypothetical protein
MKIKVQKPFLIIGTVAHNKDEVLDGELDNETKKKLVKEGHASWYALNGEGKEIDLGHEDDDDEDEKPKAPPKRADGVIQKPTARPAPRPVAEAAP